MTVRTVHLTSVRHINLVLESTEQIPQASTFIKVILNPKTKTVYVAA